MSDAPAEAPEEDAAPVDELRDGVVARLSELHPGAVIGSSVIPGRDVWVRVRPEEWVAVAESVRYTLNARYFSFLSAIDWKPSPWGRYLDAEVDKEQDAAPATVGTPADGWQTGVAGGESRFQVFARYTNVADRWGITVKADCLGGDDDPHIDSLVRVFAGADWHEREAWEMFGINFVGHPFLRHIYLPSEFEGHPLRKDFPLIARIVKPWPGIVDVEPFPNAAGDDDTAAETSEAAE